MSHNFSSSLKTIESEMQPFNLFIFVVSHSSLAAAFDCVIVIGLQQNHRRRGGADCGEPAEAAGTRFVVVPTNH